MPPVSEARKRATMKYIKEKTDEFKFHTPKGEKPVIKAHAQAMNESVNQFVNRAIKEQMKRDKEKIGQKEKATQCD